MTRQTVLALVAAVILIAAAAAATAAIPPTAPSGAPSKGYQRATPLPVYAKGRVCLNTAECVLVVW